MRKFGVAVFYVLTGLVIVILSPILICLFMLFLFGILLYEMGWWIWEA